MSRRLEILRRAEAESALFGRAAAGVHRPARPVWNGANGAQHRDCWQQLVHQIFLHRNSEAPHSLGIASPISGEGTSYVAFHLAAELARLIGRRTLLLEANLQRPGQARSHGVPPDPGLRHLLLDRDFPLDSCLHPTAVEQLWVMPAGSATNGSSGTPDWTNFSRLLGEARERFEVIIGDLPPVNLTTDTSIVSPLFDGLLLVVEADLCNREAIQSAAEVLRRASRRLLGTVLNKRKFFIPGPIYRRL